MVEPGRWTQEQQGHLPHLAVLQLNPRTYLPAPALEPFSVRFKKQYFEVMVTLSLSNTGENTQVSGCSFT